MPAVDSFVGEGLNPSPYKEALAEVERLRAAFSALALARASAAEAEVATLRALLREVARILMVSADAAMAKTSAECDCGCNAPVATDPIDMLRFLSERFKYAGVGEAVALSYARDIDRILARHDAAEAARAASSPE